MSGRSNSSREEQREGRSERRQLRAYQTSVSSYLAPDTEETASSSGESACKKALQRPEKKRRRFHMGDGVYSSCEALRFVKLAEIPRPRIFYHNVKLANHSDRPDRLREPTEVNAVNERPRLAVIRSASVVRKKDIPTLAVRGSDWGDEHPLPWSPVHRGMSHPPETQL